MAERLHRQEQLRPSLPPAKAVDNVLQPPTQQQQKNSDELPMPVANDVVGKKKTLSLLDHFPVNHIVEADANGSQNMHYTREFVMRFKNEKNICWLNKPNKQTRTDIKAKLWEQFNKALAINVLRLLVMQKTIYERTS
jgi:hypothetical protein